MPDSFTSLYIKEIANSLVLYNSKYISHRQLDFFAFLVRFEKMLTQVHSCTAVRLFHLAKVIYKKQIASN